MNFQLKLKIDNGYYYPLIKDFLDIMSDEENLSSLEDIDNFLSNHTTDEILESVKRSNISFSKPVEETEIVITYFENNYERELKTYTKDNIDYHNFSIIDFVFENMNDKNIKNQIKNYFNKNYIPQALKRFTELYAGNTTIFAIEEFRKLDYYSTRLLKNYCFEISKKQEETRKLTIE